MTYFYSSPPLVYDRTFGQVNGLRSTTMIGELVFIPREVILSEYLE